MKHIENSLSGPGIFTRSVPGLGDFSLSPFNLEQDCHDLHRWVNHERAKYWQMLNTSVDDVKKAYDELINSRHTDVFTGYFNGKKSFLLERYYPGLTSLKEHFEVQDSDMGMHVLVAPPERRIPSFTRHIFTTILDFLFSEERIQRVVVEPDVRNKKIHRLNKRAGFVYQKQISLPEKDAYLAFCSREHYISARSGIPD
ncbi:GNAT family N-acetyltransferase [Sinomicrobium weinanense]|uniref:Acetyltransferase n=1 Tax=Sinomicrobium weinanense TaxID=2842200 RepID=A0A926Q152_9FLAO|nr:GNAT family N-acetyltransferase [Sinomicrobium weinanense]MBC9794514.1 acetyltransferase [Sinomicrobium weinanense]MBU3124421.1 acetyltransferase [Sinomicrobium weinanense]